MTGVRFKETMTGRVALKSTDPVAGYAATSAFAMSMRASIETGNVAEFVGRAVPTARLRAEMVIPVVGGRFVSTHGTFELFRSGPGLDGKPANDGLHGRAGQRRSSNSHVRHQVSPTELASVGRLDDRPRHADRDLGPSGRCTAVVRCRPNQDFTAKLPRSAHDDARVR